MREREVNPAGPKSLRLSTPPPVLRDEHAEGSITRLIEQQTARIPSHYFLFAAILSMTASAALELSGKLRWSRFVGLWPPTLLITGLYNKFVKSMGPR